MKAKSQVIIITLTVIAAVGATGAWAQGGESQIPTSGEKAAGAPFEVKRDSGTFKLADRIAAKVKAGAKINYVFSYQASGIPLFSPQYAAGFETGCKLGNAIYPLGAHRSRRCRPTQTNKLPKSKPSLPPGRSIASQSSRRRSGRGSGRPPPPPQIRTCSFPASGSSDE